MTDFAQPPQMYAAHTSPVAPFTWEVRTDLLNTEESTGRVPFSFLRPVELIGLHPIVTPILPLVGGLVSPTLFDLDIQLDLNNKERFTNQASTPIATGLASSSRVALSALSTQLGLGNRLLRIMAINAAPDFGVVFGWRQFIQGTPLFENCRVSLSLFVRELTTDEYGR